MIGAENHDRTLHHYTGNENDGIYNSQRFVVVFLTENAWSKTNCRRLNFMGTSNENEGEYSVQENLGCL